MTALSRQASAASRIGVPADTVTWGSTLNEARTNTFAWRLAASPGAAIFVREGPMKRLCLLAVIVWSLAPFASLAFTWSEVLEPTPGTPHAIGSYAAGCLQGAVSLPQEGPGFQVMRRERRRFFGHPLLARYIQALGTAVAQQGLGTLAIGDLGQARGGPMPNGHRSHQNGLDVDIWFWLPRERGTLTATERATVQAPSMVAADGVALDERQWSQHQVHLLRLAAGFDVVARIFVNPVIKKALCEEFAGATWLQKMRPWWGHDDHFHVRLKCPAGETACQDQEPLPAGDGCGAELAWWFSEEARKPPPRVDITRVPLPSACADILRK
jgi:penicillin-insensitive murein endopeptidase